MVLKTEITEQIRDLLRQHPNGLNITAIVREIRINRNTAGRYLENLMVSGQVEMRHYGMAKIYRLAQRVPLSAMLSISSELIMLLDAHLRVIYANEPMLAFLGTTQKDLYGRNIEYTPCVMVFDDAYDLLKKRVKEGTTGREWTGELAVRSGSVVFSCRIAPAVLEEGQRAVSVLLENITRRKRNDEELRQNTYLQMQILNGMYQYIALLQPDGTIMRVNRAAAVASGVSEDRLAGIPFWEGAWWKISPSTQAHLKNALARAASGEFIRYEVMVKTAKGPVSIDFSLNPIRDKTGAVIQIVAEGRDITERKRAQEELIESEDRYRKLVEISPDAVVLHQNGKILYMNPAALGLIGASRSDQIIGKNIIDIVHPDYREYVRINIQKDLWGEITPPLELQLVRLDGTTVMVEGRGVRTFVGGLPAVQVAMRDITGRKKAEEALRESERKYRSLAEASPDFIFVIDRDDRVRYINSHAAALFGARVDQILNKPRSSIFPGELGQQQAERLRKVFETGTPLRSEGAMPLGNEMHWFDHYLTPVTDSGGQITSVLGISRDITDRRHTEEALRESEATARALINAPTDSILLLDTQGIILDMNETAVQRMGRREDLIGACADTVLPADVARMRREKIAQVLETKQPVRFEDERRGIWFDTVAYPILDTKGDVTRLAVIARDITDRKHAELALRETVRTFRMLANNSVDIITTIRPDGTCTYVSPAVRWTLGYDPADVTGRSVIDYLHPDDRKRVQDAIRSFDEGGADTGTGAFRVLHKDGSYVRFEGTIRAIRDGKTGSVMEFYTVSRDTGIRERF